MVEPVNVACALIERDGRLLVAQRPPAKAQGLKWEFPGGKVEPGEAGPSALCREIAEELEVAIIVRQCLEACVHDYGDFSIRLLPYVCALPSGEPSPREHVDVRWCLPSEIGALDLAEADRPVLRSYLHWIASHRGIDDHRH